MIPILAAANKTADRHKGKALVCWSGIVFDYRNHLIRADKLFLNIIQQSPSNGLLYTRVSPIQSHVNSTGRREALIRYSTEACYRVVSGNRRGRVVSSRDLEQNEEYRRTGLRKELAEGTETWRFSAARKGDAAVLSLLEGIDRPCIVETMVDTLPRIYLTVRNGRPRVRDSKDAVDYLRNCPGFDPQLDPEQNANNLRKEIAIDAGDGRDGFPYEYFYGPGVLAAEVGKLGEWFVVPSITVNLPHIQIK